MNKKIEINQEMMSDEVVKKFKELHQTENVDDSLLKEKIEKVFKENQDAVIKYKAGQKQVFGFLMGQVMKEIDKKVDPQLIRTTIQDSLES